MYSQQRITDAQRPHYWYSIQSQHTPRAAVYWLAIILVIDELDILHTCFKVVCKCRSWSITIQGGGGAKSQQLIVQVIIITLKIVMKMKRRWASLHCRGVTALQKCGVTTIVSPSLLKKATNENQQDSTKLFWKTNQTPSFVQEALEETKGAASYYETKTNITNVCLS